MIQEGHGKTRSPLGVDRIAKGRHRFSWICPVFACSILFAANAAEGLSPAQDRATRVLVQEVLLYATDHDEELPKSLDEIPDWERHLPKSIDPKDVFYFYYGKTPTELGSTTPIILTRSDSRLCIGNIAGGVECFQPAGYPEIRRISIFDPSPFALLVFALIANAVFVFLWIRARGGGKTKK